LRVGVGVRDRVPCGGESSAALRRRARFCQTGASERKFPETSATAGMPGSEMGLAWSLIQVGHLAVSKAANPRKPVAESAELSKSTLMIDPIGFVPQKRHPLTSYCTPLRNDFAMSVPPPIVSRKTQFRRIKPAFSQWITPLFGGTVVR
jgi:hypothetical protein